MIEVYGIFILEGNPKANNNEYVSPIPGTADPPNLQKLLNF